MDSLTYPDITPELLAEVARSPQVSVDTETTGLEFESRILGVGVCWSKEGGTLNSAYLNLGHPPSLFYPRHPLDKVEKLLQATARAPRFFMHNALFDLERLAFWDLLPVEQWPGDFQLVDTQAVSRIAVPFNYKEGTALKHLADRFLGGMPADVAKMKNNRGQFARMPAEAVERYGRADAEYTLLLGRTLLAEARQAYEEETLQRLLRREAAFVKLLTRMQLAGILLDTEWVQGKAGALRESRAAAAQQLEGMGLCDPASRSETIAFFRERGAKLPRTEKGNPCINEGALLELDDSAAEVLLKWRGYDKAISTWLEGYLGLVAHDGRLHPRYHAAGAISGRLSCRSPNLQAIPLSDRGASFGSMEGMFLAPPGFELWAADYGQAELRMLTSYAQSIKMATSFHEGRDVHESTAAEMWPGKEITKELRQYGKGANYTISYGGGAGALAESIGLDYDDAEEIIARHRTAFPRIAATQRQVEQRWKDNQYLRLLSGRKRFLGDNEREKAYKGFNQLVQGGVAEMVKDAMLATDALLTGTESRLLLQVHDSLELELSEEDERRGIRDEIGQAMLDAYPAWLSERTDPPVHMAVDWERWHP